MKPLAAHGGAAADLIWACATAWGVFELVLAVRAGRGGGRDRSFIPLTVSVVGGLALGVAVSRGAQGLALPGPGWWPVAVGLAHGRRPARPRDRRHRPVPPDQA